MDTKVAHYLRDVIKRQTKNLSFWLLPVISISTMACIIIFESMTVVGEDGSSISTLTIAIDQIVLDDPTIAQEWVQQLDQISGFLEGRGAEVNPYSKGRYSGVQASISFSDLATLNASLSSEGVSIFDEFTLKRWRGEFLFEAHTTSTLITQRISQITSLNDSELLLVQFPLNISVQLPGELIRSNADQTGSNGIQTWMLDWWFQDDHHLFATSRVPLIPPIIIQPESNVRIMDASEGVDFAGTGEPGADIHLYQIEGDQRRILAEGVIDASGNWSLESMEFGFPGQYIFQLEESTFYEQRQSDPLGFEYRPLEPIVFVPGFYSCSEGIFQQDINWHWGLFPSNDPGWLSTGLIPTVANIYYGPLLEYFINQGYELNHNLFVACYDWTESLPNQAAKLNQVLDWARHDNPENLPITLITHSNGGLVARYHIQHNSLSTIDQVANLILVAVPNHGALKSYYVWEGGDMSHEGDVIKMLISAALSRKCSIDLFPSPVEVYNCLHYGRMISPIAFDLATAQDENIMSVAWFLPGCDYLETSQCGFWSYPEAPINRLNSPHQLDALFQGIQGNVYVLAGNTGGISTLAQIPFVDPAPEDNPLWQHGKPDISQSPILRLGDDTVLLDSAYLPEADRYNDRYYPYPPYNGADHAKGVVQSHQVLTDISRIIDESSPTGGEMALEVSDLLIIWVESPVNLMVTDPAGNRIGVGMSGNPLGDVVDAAYGDTGDPLGPKFIIIPNPIDGSYQFALTGLADGTYELFGISSASDAPMIAESGYIRSGEVKTYVKSYVSVADNSSRETVIYFVCLILVATFIFGISIFMIKVKRKRPCPACGARISRRHDFCDDCGMGIHGNDFV